MTMVVSPVLTLDWLEKRKNIMGELDRQLIQGLQNPGTGLTLAQLQLVTEHSNPFVDLAAEQEVEETSSEPAVLTYPPVGEIFALTFDADAPENQPIKILCYFGYNPEGWRHNGLRVWGKQTGRFKLVQVGYCGNLNEVKKRLKAHGKVSCGQWMKAFKIAYSRPDGNGPIGIADASWVNPNGNANFPIVSSGGGLYFRWAGDGHDRRSRWLVAATCVHSPLNR